MGVVCSHFWIGPNGLCTECGEHPGLKHNHRFPYARAGDTMLTCVDCHQVVYITPYQAASVAKVAPPKVEEVLLPDVLFGISAKVPHYVQLAEKYNYLRDGHDEWR